MEIRPNLPRVDFRFASAEDATEIVTLVNDAFSVDKGTTGLAFTSRDRISASDVEDGMHGESAKKRWLVLETPHPEETMIAAALIDTGDTPGKGSVEILAVQPSRQREGLGSHLLRRAEGILLNFCCRFVRLRVPQWREDVMRWASKRGYKETGGGLMGELDGFNIEDLTRPTRYFILTRDLLTDQTVADSFGDGTVRFASATASAAERVSASANAAATTAQTFPGTTGSPSETNGVKRETNAEIDDSRELAGFLARALQGLTVADVASDEGHCGIAAADRSNVAPVADVRVDREAPRPMQEDAAGCSRSPDCVAVNSSGTCLPAPPAAKNDHRSFGVLDVGDITVHDVAGAGIARKGDHGVGGESGDGEEQSVESLLGSLMRALNTEQGRADFARLTAGDGI